MATINESIIRAQQIATDLKDSVLQQVIIDLHRELLKLQSENLELREKCNKQDSFNMQYENNMYYNVKLDGTKDGPYCSACWDSKHLAVRMFVRDDGFCACTVCKNQLTLPGYIEPTITYATEDIFS